MGAFSFAADTLASLSSAITPSSTVGARPIESKLSVKLDENAYRIFSEFSTGMNMLYRYGSRNPCNITKITYQNLKLLHTNLKSNKSYRDVIADIRNKAVDTHHWTWLPLLSDSGLMASMLFLPADTGISPHITMPNNSMSNNSMSNHVHQQHALSTPDDTMSQSPIIRQLYVSLLGNTTLDIVSRNVTSSMTLKSGDVFADNYQQSSIKRISAINGNSLVLNIQIPVS